MPKIMINNTNYYTDDFNEEQMKAYQEIEVATAELSRLSYVANLLENRRSTLAAFIEKLAVNKPTEEQLELPVDES